MKPRLQTYSQPQPNNRKARRRAQKKTKTANSARAQHALVELANLYQRGEIDTCIVVANRFNKNWPQLAAGWRILALCWQVKGDHKCAQTAGLQALNIDDTNADAHNIHGCTVKALGHLEAAGFHFSRAIELRPDHVESHVNLGAVLSDLKRFREAEIVLRRAVAIKPNFAIAHYQLACVLRELDRPNEAQDAFEAALRHQPNMVAAHLGLGEMSTYRGEFGAAEQYFRAAISLEPSNGALHYQLAFVKKFSAGDPDLDAIDDALDANNLTLTDQIHLHYAAGKAHDDIGDRYDTAYRHYSMAADLYRSQLDYDIERVEAEFEKVERFFTADVLASRAGVGHRSDQPVFIVGMPRSGTTLVEQILASHRDVHAKGERDDLARVCKSLDKTMQRPFPEWIDDLEDKDFLELGQRYVELISVGAPACAHITDKMLTNFKLVGLIALVLPRARVIHVRRHPLDACLSCFCQPFTSGSQFSYDLTELGRYYQAYQRLMMHWQKVLPEHYMMTVDYESVVEAPEEMARALISHCELAWDENCLNFQKTARSVKTASAAQVRRKLYSSSIGRWENYRRHLSPLITALGPLIQGHQR